MEKQRLYKKPEVEVLPLMGESPFMALAPSKDYDPNGAPKRRQTPVF